MVKAILKEGFINQTALAENLLQLVSNFGQIESEEEGVAFLRKMADTVGALEISVVAEHYCTGLYGVELSNIAERDGRKFHQEVAFIPYANLLGVFPFDPKNPSGGE